VLHRQLADLLKGDNSPSANGGYPSQFEAVFITSALLAKNTPEVWSKFSDDEKKKFDTLVKALLVGSAYTSSDETNQPGATVTSIDGSTVNRAWGAHYREGMTGVVIGAVAFLGEKEAEEFLKNYNHAEFSEELQTAGLDNTHFIFTKKAREPESTAPAPEAIENAVKHYRFFGQELTDSMNIYLETTRATYSGIVAAGLNNGEGIDGGGKIVSGADKLPNIGKHGQLAPFNGYDATGQASNADAAYTSFRPNTSTQIALIVAGKLDYSNADWKNHVLPAVNIGNEDLFFKLEHGYINFGGGKPAATPTTMEGDGDKQLMRFIWEKIVLPYHKENTK